MYAHRCAFCVLAAPSTRNFTPVSSPCSTRDSNSRWCNCWYKGSSSFAAAAIPPFQVLGQGTATVRFGPFRLVLLRAHGSRLAFGTAAEAVLQGRRQLGPELGILRKRLG